jgi:D-alanyl-lipoteichoic acid acyltransferase DltB (MBOAT superfamily)
MLFSSYAFLFQFLPATVLAFAAARRHSPRAGIMVLAGASLFFYGAWRPVYLLLFIASIGINFGLGLRMEDRCAAAPSARSASRSISRCSVISNIPISSLTA